MDTAQLKKVYKETIAPALQKQFNYSSAMEIPVLKKIVINQGLGDATQDKKIVDVAINEITAITGQKAVATYSKKDIANFKLRKKMPIGVMVTLRREREVELSFEGFRFCDLQRWLLLTEAPYNQKFSQEFDRVESPDFYTENDPKDAEVANYRRELILTRNFDAKHYWFPLPIKETQLYPEFNQNPGW